MTVTLSRAMHTSGYKFHLPFPFTLAPCRHTHTLQVKWFGGRKGWLWCRLANSWIERPEKQFDNQLTLFYLKQPRGRTGDHNESSRYVKTASRFHITGKSEGLRWCQLHSIPWHPLLDNINCSS
jgi:hypothetical protein